MTNLEKIHQEIERLENMDYPCDTFEQATGFYNALDRISNFIDSLPEEHFRDSTKMLSEDLEKAADSQIRKMVDAAGHPGWDWTTQDVINAFIAGAKWQKAKDDEETADLLTIVAIDAGQRAREEMPLPEDTVIFMKGVAEGRRLERDEREENKRKENELPRFYGD